MIVNGQALLRVAPIKDMLDHKVRGKLVSHGLTEAGYDIRIRESVMLDRTCRVALASTLDEFQMPEDMVGVVHDKSTWARKWLSVQNTVIEPGWRGWLTLELVYNGNGVLMIPAGAGIAQVLFSRLAEPAAYDGKYQDQEARPVEARHG